MDRKLTGALILLDGESQLALWYRRSRSHENTMMTRMRPRYMSVVFLLCRLAVLVLSRRIMRSMKDSGLIGRCVDVGGAESVGGRRSCDQ